MKKTILTTLGAILAASAVIAAEPAALEDRLATLEAKLDHLESTSASSVRGYWKNGFFIEQPDKAFSLQIGGRFQLDSSFYSADDELTEAVAPFDDGVKFRRAYLFTRGTIYDNLSFVMEYNFAGDTSFQNVYMAVSDMPVVGTLLAGQTLEPMGLEENSSNNSITLMERGFTSALNPVYNVGLLAYNTVLNQRLRWAAGVFKDTNDLGNSVSNEGFAVTARLTGLPYLADDGKQYLHLGASMSHRDTEDSGYRLRARPDSFIAPYVVDTKSMDTDTADLAALEAALMIKSLFIQSEWSMATVDLNPTETILAGGDAEFSAFYVSASCFLTGEYRPYSKNSATIGRVTPKRNATGKQWGSGAWEIAARYNTIDLVDGEIEGGEMDTITLGLNWYLNPHARVMWNYVMADVKDTGDVDTFQMRFQFDF